MHVLPQDSSQRAVPPIPLIQYTAVHITKPTSALAEIGLSSCVRKEQNVSLCLLCKHVFWMHAEVSCNGNTTAQSTPSYRNKRTGPLCCNLTSRLLLFTPVACYIPRFNQELQCTKRKVSSKLFYFSALKEKIKEIPLSHSLHPFKLIWKLF